MQITVDYRESKIISLLKNTGLEFNTANLVIGDVELKHEDSVVLIERKTLDDYSSSIIDGRFREQKSRLMQSGATVIYIIEGQHKSNHGIPLSSLYSSMFSMQYRDKVIVMRSLSLDETVSVLQSIVKKMQCSSLERTNSYKIVKKQSANDNYYVNMLCCIPGISEIIAQNVQQKFPTLQSLIAHVNDTNSLKCIDKIGTILSLRIVNVLKYNKLD